MKRKLLDLLLVTNQNVSFEEMGEKLSGVSSCLILSSHRYFKTEQNLLEKQGKLLFFSFVDFLNDDIMKEIDNQTTATLKKLPWESYEYISLYQKTMLKKKNEYLKKIILKKYKFKKIYAYNGLGVDANVWNKPDSLVSKKIRQYDLIQQMKNVLIKMKSKISNFFCITETIDYIFYKNRYCLIFPKGTNRLNFAKEVMVNHFIFTHPKNLSDDRKIIAIKNYQKRKNQNYEMILCYPLHLFNFVSKNNDLIWIFQDGYLPSNYPEAYLPAFQCNCFICNSPFSLRWFNKFGYNAKILPDLLEYPLPIVKSKPFTPVKNFLVVLGHAGDWTALINRSDTEQLLQGIIFIAQKNKEYNFFVRLHPTMTHPSHEGVLSASRIKKYIESQQIVNLIISENTLEEDIQNSDILIGEYSNVLVKALIDGYPIIIANFTGRRSFFKDYEQFGFTSFSSFKTMQIFFQEKSNFISFYKNYSIGREKMYIFLKRYLDKPTWSQEEKKQNCNLH